MISKKITPPPEGVPLISVIIPVYNGELYIEECVQSIIDNQYENMEILIVDDGSTDNTKKNLKKYSLTYDNIYVFEENHLGVSHARNVGLKNAKGDFIAFIDADDWIGSEYFHNLIAPMLKDDDIDICQVVTYRINDAYAIYNSVGDLTYSRYISHNDALIDLFNSRVNASLYAKLFCKELLTDFICSEDLIYGEDIFDCFKLFCKAKKIYFCNNYKKFMDFGAYYYRKNPLGSSLLSKEIKYFNMLCVYFKILHISKAQSYDFLIEIIENKITKLYENIMQFLISIDLQSDSNDYIIKLIDFHKNQSNYMNQILRRIIQSNFNFLVNNTDLIFYLYDILLENTHNRNRNLYIYGVGEYGIRIAKILTNAGILFNGFIVSDNIDIDRDYYSFVSKFYLTFHSENKDINFPPKIKIYHLSEINFDDNNSPDLILGLGVINLKQVLPAVIDKNFHKLYIYEVRDLLEENNVF